ncbi:DUF2750 domain-containing protein [Gayadomonas joobiniege]|uniref:DUF2750 domain-containing protein n=1 Tax=Gayadomonas joobiniege TaxID=1234606 RepID=UPI00058C3107|nr:DUF2750 domain-containing protein [Gayadomonas joobiniege]
MIVDTKAQYGFYHEVAQSFCLFTIVDAAGIPTPANEDGQKTMPFWSNEEKAQAFIQANPDFAGFQPLRVDWAVFEDKWFAGIVADDLVVGLNWLDYQNENLIIEVETLQKEVHNIIKTQPLKK